MPKSAIINVDRKGLIEKMSFKKLSLFFDRIYIEEKALLSAEHNIKKSKKLTKIERNSFLAELDWLREQNLIRTYGRDSMNVFELNNDLEENLKALHKYILERYIPPDELELSQIEKPKSGGVIVAPIDLIFKIEDLGMRSDAVRLGLKEPATQFIPIVNSFESCCRKQSSDMVLHFILGKIPVPDSNTPWEEILEFRNDAVVRRKYYALLNWINEISQQDMPLPHLADKYNQLYSEYMYQYSLHKLTSSYTILEILVVGGIDFVSSLLQHNVGAAFKGLLTIRKEQVGLLRAEKDIPGRELGYIFSANEKFKK